MNVQFFILLMGFTFQKKIVPLTCLPPAGQQNHWAYTDPSLATCPTLWAMALQSKKTLLQRMNNAGIKYQFTTKPWQYAGPAGWYFASLPYKSAKEIRDALKSAEEGWGRLKATAKIGNSEWKTAIWFDTKMGTYLLPLKAEIRKKENLLIGKNVKIVLWV